MDGISLELTHPRLIELDPDGATSPSVQPSRPAQFARYGDLSSLRYDYPLVLVRHPTDGGCVSSLASIFDGLIRDMAPKGAPGEALRRQLLQLEARIRGRVMGGIRATLTQHWREAERALLADTAEAERATLAGSLDVARDSLGIDGEIIDCDGETPVTFLVHAWNTIHAAKAKAFRKRVDGLILKLSDILKADFVKSNRARSPEVLRTTVGASFEPDIDFEALSRVLVEGSHHELLSDERRRRIEAVLMVLQSQRFYGPGRASGPRVDEAEPYSFVFDNCAAAMDAFRDRMPQMVDFIEAVSIAELEIRNRYRPALHDPFFERFDESELTVDDLALFPSCLVCLRDGESDAAEMVRALEAIASGFPVKVLIQTDDILGDPSPEPPRTSFGGGSARLAAMALGVNNAFVFQAASSSLRRMQRRVLEGLVYDGPALFSIYSGATDTVSGVPPYLLAAAATESRAFPCFSYDPAAGPDWAARFRIADNPQAASDWPSHALHYEDEALQRVGETVAFTHTDFAICDARYARHWVSTSHDKWTEKMVPVADWLEQGAGAGNDRVPYIWTLDGDDRLRRTVVDDRLIDAARRCRETWRGLQELGGINNSHARQQVAAARERWEDEKARELAALRSREGAPAAPAAVAPVAAAPAPATPTPAAPAAAATATATEAPAAEAEAPSSDDPYIETPRCTTCNECTEINNKMFVYNDNKQAYIADPDAGTFRQLVEAAESCQVSIIHPGKPRNMDEPGLDELIERAGPFN